MAHEERTMSVWACDGCDKEVVMSHPDEPPTPWWTGNVVTHQAAGGWGGRWDACSEAHIKKAVMAALERRD